MAGLLPTGLKEGQLLLTADPNYLNQEASKIIRDSFERCHKQIFKENNRLLRGETIRGEAKGMDVLDVAADRQFLGIDPDENLSATLGTYAEQVAESRRILQEAGIS